jgi:hypothetical protein
LIFRVSIFDFLQIAFGQADTGRSIGFLQALDLRGARDRNNPRLLRE